MSRIYVGGLRHPVDQDGIVALLSRAHGVDSVNDVEIREGGNPLEQDCYAFANVEPANAADSVVRTFNKCKWRKLVLKVEKVNQGAFELSRLKTPQGFVQLPSTRKRGRPEAEIIPLSSKPIRVRRREGQRNIVQVASDRRNQMKVDFDSSDSSDSDDSDASSEWGVDFADMSSPKPAEEEVPEEPIDEAKAERVRRRLQAFETGITPSQEDEEAEAIDSENTQLLGMLSSLLQQGAASATKEEQEFAEAYGIRREKNSNVGPVSQGAGVVNFLNEEEEKALNVATSKAESSVVSFLGKDEEENLATASKTPGVVSFESDEEDGSEALSAPAPPNGSPAPVVNENRKSAVNVQQEDEDVTMEDRNGHEADSESAQEIANANSENSDGAPKTKLRGIFEDFLANKDQASSFSLFGGAFESDAVAEVVDQQNQDEVEKANEDIHTKQVDIAPDTKTFRIADIISSVDRSAAKLWPVSPAKRFQRRGNYEKEFYNTRETLSNLFRNRAKQARRQAQADLH
mmetsp:Transcript_17796/g.35166  ORF Transcript_17796/g.35166 Transcript_17796/m.35166 type:complete len:517 (-) Transcript_17796:103-1653(-)